MPDHTVDDVLFPEACRRLEESGAAVVGLNCARGPSSMLPLLKEIREVCKVRHVYPSKHLTSKQCRINVDATSFCRVDVHMTLY